MFEKHYRELKHFLLNRLRDPDMASDAVQECFSRAVTMQREGVAVQDPRALLFRIANNWLIDQHRKKQTQPEHFSLDDDQNGPEYCHAPHNSIHPERIASSKQKLQHLLATVESLPPRCRETFILFKVDGLSYQEIAQQMNISVRTVEMQLRIAMAACTQGIENRKNRTTPTHRNASLAATPLLLVAACLFVWHTQWSTEQHSLQTVVGEIQSIELKDGSRITLDTNTRLNVKYTHASRTVELVQGQARFDVKPDQDRPFKVQTSHARVSVLGTVFDIRQTDLQNSNAAPGTTITVSEGLISVDHAKKPNWPDWIPYTPYQQHIKLKARQRYQLDSEGTTGRLTEHIDTSTLQWPLNRLRFIDAPLNDIVAELNRYSEKPWHIQHSKLGTMRVSASLDMRNKQAIIDVLSLALPVRVIEQKDQYRVVQR